MTIEFKEGRYFAAMWFISGEDRDWNGALYREGKDTPWVFRYRFRYYAETSENPFDGEDRKSWWTATLPVDRGESEIMKLIATMADAIADELGGPVHKLILRTDSSTKIMAAMEREDWCHVKEVVPGSGVGANRG